MALSVAAAGRLYRNSAPGGTLGTIAYWVRSSSSSNQDVIVKQSSAAYVAHYIGMSINAYANRSYIYDAVGGGSTVFSAAGAGSSGVYQHAAAVFTSSTSRKVFRDGGNAVTNAVSRNPVGLDSLTIGSFRTATSVWAAGLNGLVAEVGIWDIALLDAEVAQLAAGYAPSLIQPEHLVAYYPLISDYNDYSGNENHLLSNGTVGFGTHPPGMIYSLVSRRKKVLMAHSAHVGVAA